MCFSNPKRRCPFSIPHLFLSLFSLFSTATAMADTATSETAAAVAVKHDTHHT